MFPALGEETAVVIKRRLIGLAQETRITVFTSNCKKFFDCPFPTTYKGIRLIEGIGQRATDQSFPLF